MNSNRKSKPSIYTRAFISAHLKYERERVQHSTNSRTTNVMGSLYSQLSDFNKAAFKPPAATADESLCPASLLVPVQDVVESELHVLPASQIRIGDELLREAHAGDLKRHFYE